MKAFMVGLAFFCGASSLNAADAIYSCKGKDGSYIFSDRPCGNGVLHDKRSADLLYQQQLQQQHLDAERKAAREKYDQIPIEPAVGMTSEEWSAIRTANYARLESWNKEHGSVLLDSRGYDGRWFQWSWCSQNKTTTARGVHEQWVCGGSSRNTYVYTDNGIVTSIQE